MGRGQQNVLYGRTRSRSAPERELPEGLGPEALELCLNRLEEKNGQHCGAPAEFILWGMLFPLEALGPRCWDCAVKQVGADALQPAAGYAVFHL